MLNLLTAIYARYQEYKSINLEGKWYSASIILSSLLGALSSGITAYDAVTAAASERFELWIISLVTGSSALAIATAYLFLRNYFKRITEQFFNITAMLLRQKFNEVALAAVGYCLIGWISYYYDRLDLVYLAISVAILQFSAFGLTFFRVVTGRFGYNSLEMKEILNFVKTAGHGTIPPRTGGLRPSPLEGARKSVTMTEYGTTGVSR